jgi:hypothetical protein
MPPAPSVATEARSDRRAVAEVETSSSRPVNSRQPIAQRAPPPAGASALRRRERVRCPKLFRGDLDLVTLQTAVELKPREAQEPGGAPLVTMRPLECVDDGLALELL